MMMRPSAYTDSIIFSAILLIVLPSHSQTCTVDGGKFYQVLLVEEERPVGYVIGTLNLDSPSRVSRISASESNSYIQLNVGEDRRSGTFSVSRRIDADTGLNRIQTMYIECTTDTGLKLEIEMEFDIVDINDHSPSFIPSNTYNFSISERALPGTQIGTVRAKDGDIKNSYIQYELLTESPAGKTVFQLSSSLSNGGVTISLTTSLDYETQNSYTLKITAKDCQQRHACTNGQYTSTAMVNIEVVDEDDLNPEFDQSSYQVSLSQDAKNDDLVVQVTAHDQDELNELIVYKLSGDGSEYFHIHSITGKVSVRDSSILETGNNFYLHVKAEQKSDATKKDVATLIISVISSDSDKPQFTERTYVTSLSEYSPVNTSVLSMALNYNLQRSPLVVQLQPPSGNAVSYFTTKHLGNNVDLILIKNVNFENLQSHRVKIVASNEKFSDEVEVVIHILNENDNNPVFDQMSYSFHLLRKEPGIVGHVSATDADNPKERIAYRVLESDTSALFGMDEEGELTTIGDEMEYTKNSYTLIAEASDAGVPPRTTNAVITLTFEDVQVAEKKSSERSPMLEDRVLYPICAAAIVMVLVASITVCVLYTRRTKQRLRSKRNNTMDSNRQSPTDPTFTPLCKERIDSSSSLGLMSVMNERRENTYRDMSQLNHDENYRLMWRRSGLGRSLGSPEMNGLLEPQNGSNSSDSGNSSGTDAAYTLNHHCSQSEAEDTINRTTTGRYSPNSMKRGYISTYLQEQKKQQSIESSPAVKSSTSEKDNGLIVEAPAGFRTPMDSRPASISESTHSDYAVSNTSDYGSNTVPTDSSLTPQTKIELLKNYTVTMGTLESRENIASPTMSNHSELEQSNVITIKALNPHQVIALDSNGELGQKKPFTTFHGDLV